MYYQLTINRKYLKKLEKYLQQYNYTNYHYQYINDYVIVFEIFMYHTLQQYEHCLRNFGDLQIIK